MKNLQYILYASLLASNLQAFHNYSEFANITNAIFKAVAGNFESDKKENFEALQNYINQVANSVAAHKMHKLNKSNNFTDIIRYIDKDTIVLLDIDEVCRSYVSCSKANKDNLPPGYLIETEEIKNTKFLINNKAFYIDYVGPTGEDLKGLADHCNKVGAKIIGLTTTGNSRSENLKEYFEAIGVNFTTDSSIKNYRWPNEDGNHHQEYGFLNGIIYCGHISVAQEYIKHKGAHLQLFIDANPELFNAKTNNIVFVDDFLSNLTDVYQYAFASNIPSVLVHYDGFTQKNSDKNIQEELKELGEYKATVRNRRDPRIYNFRFQPINPFKLFLWNFIKDKIGFESPAEVLCAEKWLDVNDILSLDPGQKDDYSRQAAKYNKQISSVMNLLSNENYFHINNLSLLPFNYRWGQSIPSQLCSSDYLHDNTTVKNLVPTFFSPFLDPNSHKEILDDIIKIYQEKNQFISKNKINATSYSSQDLILLYQNEFFVFILSNGDALGAIQEILRLPTDEFSDYEIDELKIFFESMLSLHHMFSTRMRICPLSLNALKKTGSITKFISHIKDKAAGETQLADDAGMLEYYKRIAKEVEDEIGDMNKNTRAQKLNIRGPRLIGYLMGLKDFYLETHNNSRFQTDIYNSLIDGLINAPEALIIKFSAYIKKNRDLDKQQRKMIVGYLNEIIQLKEKLNFDSQITIPYRDKLFDSFVLSPLALLEDIKLILQENNDAQIIKYIDILKDLYLELFFKHLFSGNSVKGNNNVEKIQNSKAEILKGIHKNVKFMVNAKAKD